MKLMNDLTQADLAAMSAALESTRNEDEGRAQQIAQKLAEDPWVEVGEFAAYHCQIRSLNLDSADAPPCWINNPDHPDDGFDGWCDGKQEAAKLLKEMLALGISKYDPDPLAAIAKAKARAKVKKA